MRFGGKFLVALVLLALVCAPAAALAGHHGDDRPMKTGILLVTFGTSVPEAQAVYAGVEKAITAAHPDIAVRWAYTSRIIREKLAKQGQVCDSPVSALARMQDENFTHVAVQSLHVIPGAEFNDLLETARAFKGLPEGFQKIVVGRPLLVDCDDMSAAAAALIANLPKERKAGEPVILMGHGTPHPSDVYYPAMQYTLWQQDEAVFLGTVEGHPTLDDVVAALKARGAKAAWLMPFMTVAGDHALNDMAGDEPDSWKSVLTKEGIECRLVVQGIAAYPEIVEIWLAHLQIALDHLK